MKELGIVVPTYNERDNIAPLVEGIAGVLSGRPWRLLVVDDVSPDGTWAEVERVAEVEPRVACLRRIGRRGLASAVIEGCDGIGTDWIGVMDADLQHDPACLPPMLGALDGGADLVLASRFAAGAGREGLGGARTLLSGAGIALANAAAGIRSTDPLTGFFLFDRGVWEEARPRLTGRGFKILLDLVLASPRKLRIDEVPLQFRPRHAGASKLDWQVAWAFLAMLAEHGAHRIGGRSKDQD